MVISWLGLAKITNLIGSLRPTTTAYQMDLEEFASFILDTNVRLGPVFPKEVRERLEAGVREEGEGSAPPDGS